MNIGFLCKNGNTDKNLEKFANKNIMVEKVINIDWLSDISEVIRKKTIQLVMIDLTIFADKGMEIAKFIQGNFKEVDVVLIDDDVSRTIDAFKIPVHGFMLEPISEDDFRYEIKKSFKKRNTNKKNIFIRTFGHFDVFVNGDALHFTNTKSKEFLAILVDECGGVVDMDRAITYLWPTRDYDENVKSRYRNMLKELREVLIEADIYEIISEKRNSRSINRSKFICDYYRLLTGDEKSINEFNGEYMFNYDWSAKTIKKIELHIEKVKNK